MRKPLDNLSSEARKYADLRMDDLKLRAVDGLSVGVSRVLTLMTLVMILAIVLAAFAFGSVLLLGEWLGSWTIATFIIGGVFLLLLLILVAFRKRLFLNVFVRLFIGIFYGNE